MRKTILVLIIVVATGCLCLVILSASHKIIVRTYFHHAQGLIPGARVRVDGVEVGFVRDVSVEAEHAEHKDRPIAVRMALNGAEGLQIPSDSIASLETEGVLGPTFVEIDTHDAKGPPVDSNAVLESIEPSGEGGAARVFELVGESLLKESKKLREKDRSPVDPVKSTK